MKYYVAGRVKKGPGEIRAIIDDLRQQGHEVTFDWTEEPSYKPYSQNENEARLAADRMLEGVRQCDVFILLWDDSLYGALIELGAALAYSRSYKRKQVYILGDKQRESIFETLTNVTVVQNFKDTQPPPLR